MPFADYEKAIDSVQVAAELETIRKRGVEVCCRKLEALHGWYSDLQAS